MRKVIPSFVFVAVSILFCVDMIAQANKPAAPPPGFEHKYANLNGVKIHYITGAKGEPLLLIHGLAKTGICGID